MAVSLLKVVAPAREENKKGEEETVVEQNLPETDNNEKSAAEERGMIEERKKGEAQVLSKLRFYFAFIVDYCIGSVTSGTLEPANSNQQPGTSKHQPVARNQDPVLLFKIATSSQEPANTNQ